MKKKLVVFAMMLVMLAGIAPSVLAEGEPAAGATEAAVVFEAKDVEVEAGTSDFDLLSGVSAQNENQEPLQVALADDGGFDVNTPAAYTVTYTAQHAVLGQQTARRTVTVTEKAQQGAGAANNAAKAHRGPAANEVTVNDVGELVDAIQNATGATIIKLADGFNGAIASATTITVPGATSFDITVQGNAANVPNSTFTAQGSHAHFTIANNGSGALAFRNVLFDGNTTGGGVAVSSGNVSFYETTFSRIVAANALSTGAGNVTVSASSFNNITGNALAAGSGSVTVNQKTTFQTISKTAIVGGSGALAVDDSSVGTVGSVTIQGMGIAAGSGPLTVTDTVFEGIKEQAVNSGSSSKVTIQGSRFSQAGGAVIGGADVEIDNCLFENVNKLGTHYSAISIGTKLRVTNSTFYNSGGGYTWNGRYTCGAIGGIGSGKDVVIANSYFEGNKGNAWGGAISLYQASGTFVIENNYFKGNSVDGTDNRSNRDGGAIGYWGNGQGPNMTIRGNTFEGNTAYDDGGAIFFEDKGYKNTLTIENNTFAANKGGTWLLPADTGGAVQISLDCNATFRNNTFYANTKSSPGAAIGFHADSANASNTPKMWLYNNLFVGNTRSNAVNNVMLSYVYSSTTFTALLEANIGNVGMDNGAALPAGLNATSVFGTASPALAANGSTIMAGSTVPSANVGGPRVVPTLLLVSHAPGADAGTYADGVADPNFATAADQRGEARSASEPCAGAVEIKPASLTFSITYEKGTGDTVDNMPVGVSDVTAGGNFTVASETPRRTGYTFTGWQTTDVAASTETYQPGGSFTMPNNDVTLTATWRINTHDVIYRPGAPSGVTNMPANVTGNFGSSISVSGRRPLRAGYTFTGWQTTDVAASTETYQPGGSFTMPNNDVTLTATWQINRYTVTFDARGGSAVSAITGVAHGNRIGAPQAPTRNNYTFAGWYTSASGGAQWSFNTNRVWGNTTLYARWVAVPVTPPVPPAPTPTPTPTPAPTPAVVEPPAESISQPEPSSSVSQPAQSESEPTESVNAAPAPLDAPPAGHWSLLNLVLAVLGGIVSIVLLATAFMRKANTRRARSVVLWRVLGTVGGLVAILVFLITQDMSLPMQLADGWTILMALIAALQAVCAVLTLRKKEDEEEPNANEEPPTSFA